MTQAVLEGTFVEVGGVRTFVHDVGSGPAVLLLHGSGPGVSAAANWRLTIPALVEAGYRVIAPDLAAAAGRLVHLELS